MNYRALLSSSLESIGVDPHQVQQIESGAEMYGAGGVLDSVHLVGLIAAIEDALDPSSDTRVNLFSERGIDLLDDFRDADTLIAFLERRSRVAQAPARTYDAAS
jgi:acyl carrier protein